jgi:hypothetical protein
VGGSAHLAVPPCLPCWREGAGAADPVGVGDGGGHGDRWYCVFFGLCILILCEAEAGLEAGGAPKIAPGPTY